LSVPHNGQRKKKLGEGNVRILGGAYRGGIFPGTTDLSRLEERGERRTGKSPNIRFPRNFDLQNKKDNCPVGHLGSTGNFHKKKGGDYN